ncbi:hypothetical protein T492DRAFT_866949 [Pavlovales sp. CCMP2436]|nr:hypothetical protein T492DRAFT_866949 [Pavlovales sp. CCMP2436]
MLPRCSGAPASGAVGRLGPLSLAAGRGGTLAACTGARQQSTSAPISARWLGAEPTPPYTAAGKLRTGLRAISAPWNDWVVEPPREETLAVRRAILNGPLAPSVSASDGSASTLEAEAEVCVLLRAYMPSRFPNTPSLPLPSAGGRLSDAARVVEEVS